MSLAEHLIIHRIPLGMDRHKYIDSYGAYSSKNQVSSNF